MGVGGLAAFFGYAGVSILAYPVYNMLLGVPAAAVGLALMIPRLWDAVTDPLAGYISDNHRGRLGRRRPFIVLGAAAMGLLFVAIWAVPPGWSDSAKLAYFVGTQLLFFTAYTVFAVPFAALSYELTPDYHERTRVMSYLAFFHKAGEFLGGWMVPFAISLGALWTAWWLGSGPDDPTLSQPGVLLMAILIGIGLMAVLGAMPGLFVRERFRHDISRSGQRVRLWSSIRDAARSKPFLILVAVIVLNTLSGVLAMGIDQYLLVYYMSGGDTSAGMVQKALLTSGYAVVGFVSIPVITFLAGRLGKKGALFFVYSLMIVGGIAKWFVFVPGWSAWQIGPVTLVPALLIDPLLCGPMWVAVKILLASMMADICDDDELRHGQRREGMFGAVFSWLEKMVVSLAYLLTGLALGVSGFVVELGAAQAPETFTNMRLFFAGAPAVTAAFALLALIAYPIDAARAPNTRAELEARRGVLHTGN